MPFFFHLGLLSGLIIFVFLKLALISFLLLLRQKYLTPKAKGKMIYSVHNL